jgi:hypothetical protein
MNFSSAIRILDLLLNLVSAATLLVLLKMKKMNDDKHFFKNTSFRSGTRLNTASSNFIKWE